MKTKELIHKGSDNIFADIGATHPERVQARAHVMFLVSDIIKKRGLTQKQAAAILGIPQSKVSCLVNGRLSNFSMDHLFELLNALEIQACLTRGKSRDFYDLYFILRGRMAFKEAFIQDKQLKAKILKVVKSGKLDFKLELKAFLPVNQHIISYR